MTAAIRQKSVIVDSKDMSLFWNHVLRKQSIQKKHITFQNAASAVLKANKIATVTKSLLDQVREKDSEMDDEDDDKVTINGDMGDTNETTENDLTSILEQDIGQLLSTKIQAAVSTDNKQLLCGLNVTTSSEPDKATESKKKRFYGIKADYSNVTSKLYSISNHAVKLRHEVEKKRQMFKQLQTQLLTIHCSNDKNDRNVLNNISEEERHALEKLDMAMESYGREIHAFKENGRILYDIDNESADLKKHPYYQFYAGIM